MIRRLMEVAAGMAGISLFGASTADAAACPLKIGFAALQATGTNHASREYVALLDGPTSSKETVVLELGVANRGQLGIEVPASSGVLVVLARTDAMSIRIAGVKRDERASLDACDDARPFTIRPTNLTQEFSFDDNAAWVQKDGVTALPFDVPTMSVVLLSDYTERARRRSLQGTAHLVAAIDKNGIVQDAEVLESSGSVELDNIAIEAALGLRFAPARLPAQDGAAIGALDDIVITFTPGMTTARSH